MSQAESAGEIRVRPAEAGDLRSITDIRLASFSDTDSFITDLGAEATHRYLRWMFEHSSDFFFVCASYRGEIAGYAIAAKPGYRNKRDFIRQNVWFLTYETLKRPRRLWRESFLRRIGTLLKSAARSRRSGNRERRSNESTGDGQERRPFILLDTAVHPRYQKLGIGTRLLIAREDLARAKGYSRIACTVDSRNTPSIKLHEKHGYSRMSQDQGPVRMEKKLI